jgi:hypothetical protein
MQDDTIRLKDADASAGAGSPARRRQWHDD